MCRAAVIAQVLGVAIAVPVEWKGVFYTPDASYKWGAQKVLGKANTWAYADATMKMAAIPVNDATAQSLANADSKGTTALALACEEVKDGATIIPAENKCFTLVFDALKSQTLFTIDSSNAGSIAFFLQHMPWEFETTEHYLKDTSKVDIEPVSQDPKPKSSGDGHGHSHSHGGAGWFDEFNGKCVCQAKAHSWKLNCTDTAKIEAAVAALEADGACAGISPPQTCIDHFYVMQAHHDHCLTDQLPKDVEKKLHKYEQFYTDCHVKRQFDIRLKAGACKAVTCTDQTSLTLAIQTLQNGDCNTTSKCAASSCSAAIKTVLMAHDTCKEDQLPNNLETALHDFEDHCAAELCNSAPAVFDAYAEPCEARVASEAFGVRCSLFVMTWALLMLMLSQ